MDDEAVPGPRAGRRTFLSGAAAAVGLAAVPTAGAAGRSFEPRAARRIEGVKEAVVDESGEVVYVATTDGFATVDVSDPATPTVLASIDGIASDRDAGPLRNVRDLSVSGDRLVVGGPAGGPFPLQGFAVYDVSDPANPRTRYFHETGYDLHNVFLQGDVVYLTANGLSGKPVAMLDVAGGTATKVGEFTPATYDMYPSNIHDMYVAGDTLYAAYWDLGTWVVDVSDPAAPEPRLRVGFDLDVQDSPTLYSLPGNSHYVQPHPRRDVIAVGKETYTGPMGGIELWDVSDASNPTRACIIAPPEQGDLRTAHNFGWRGDRLYASWYSGGVSVDRVRDPTSPTRLAAWRDPGERSFWTAKPIHDGFVGAARGPGGGGVTPGLLTFPEPSGDGTTPTRTMEPVAPADYRTDFGTDTATGTASGTSTGAETSTSAETSTGAGTTVAGDEATDVDDDEPTDTPTTVPGLGPLSALAAGGLAGWRLLRNRSDADE